MKRTMRTREQIEGDIRGGGQYSSELAALREILLDIRSILLAQGYGEGED